MELSSKVFVIPPEEPEPGELIALRKGDGGIWEATLASRGRRQRWPTWSRGIHRCLPGYKHSGVWRGGFLHCRWLRGLGLRVYVVDTLGRIGLPRAPVMVLVKLGATSKRGPCSRDPTACLVFYPGAPA